MCVFLTTNIIALAQTFIFIFHYQRDQERLCCCRVSLCSRVARSFLTCDPTYRSQNSHGPNVHLSSYHGNFTLSVLHAIFAI